MASFKSSEIFSKRRRLLLGGLGLITAILLGRAVELQWYHKGFLQNEGKARYLRVVSDPAHRGLILDRNGEPLAVSSPVDSVWVNPLEFAAERQRWPGLARLLGLKVEHLEQLLKDYEGREFAYLKRHLDPQIAAQVRTLGMRGVYLQREYRRYYPAGEVTAHVVGFTNVDDVGQEGMEMAFNDRLQGIDGSQRVIRDRLGRIVEGVENLRAPRPGRDLVLSIDLRLQYQAYRSLQKAVERHKAAAGSVVVLDVTTGEVLAMVNQPSYNPNKRIHLASAQSRNRVVTDLFEPGSTIKPFTVAAALEVGRFKPGTLIDTAPGFFRVGRYTVRDIHNYGRIDVSTVIKKSSNVGASKIALAIAPEVFWRVLSGVGFGELTGCSFPGEAAGVLTRPGGGGWSDIHRATLSFGYGLSVTPLQLARAYAVFAQQGLSREVSLQRLETPGEGRQVMAENAARQVLKMLAGVVDKGGTAQRAQVEGYQVAGKTGTVRKSIAGGYSRSRYIAVFAGIAPLSDPRLVAVVTIDEPKGREYYGGLVAAPVFSEVMGAALRLRRIAPDNPLLALKRVSLGSGSALPPPGSAPGNALETVALRTSTAPRP
jgi:cell division protein FtsI (penicillin-binding protein 3)